MNKRDLALLAVLVPLAMALASGFGLAHWDDEIEIYGSVSMGVFNVTMSLEGVEDNEEALDVGTITASLYNVDDGDDIDGGIIDGLEVVISNMYPGYNACVTFNIENSGTIPAVNATAFIEAFEDAITGAFGPYISDVEFSLWYLTDTGAVLLAHLADDGTFVVDYDFTTDPEGILFLDVGEAQYFKLCLGLDVDPNATEELMGQSFSFTVAITWQQAVP